jgi:hypothetical protein
MLWIAKRPLPLARLVGHDPAFELLFRSWSELRADGRLPPGAMLRASALPLLIPDLVLAGLDALRRDAAPMLGALARWATAPADPQAARADEPPRPSLGALAAADRETIAYSGSPVFQVFMVRDLAGRVESWLQLVCPLANDGVRVDELVLLVAPQRRDALVG